jgi:peroxiredoxin
MSDRTLHDACAVGLPDDGLFDDAFVSGYAIPVAADPPPSGQIADADGVVDALAEPQAPPYAAGPGGGVRPGWRERVRSSRYGTLVVLVVTAALVAGGIWLVNGAKSGAATASGTTSVSLPGTSKVPPPQLGQPAQDFTVTTIDGARVKLSQFKGKPVWLVFGASWCTACQAEVPEIEAAYKEYAPQGLVVLGVNIAEGQDAVRDYARRVGITFPIGADPDSAVADAYRVSAIPAHFFIDRGGVLRGIRQGSVSADTIATSLKGLTAP